MDEEFYDETDDMIEDEIIDPGHCLPSNEEIFKDKYMIAFAEKMDAKIARDKRIDMLVSVLVIVAVTLAMLLVFFAAIGYA